MVNVGLNYSCPGCNQAVGLLPAGYVCPTTGGTQPGHEPVARRTRPRPVRRAIAGVGESLDDIIKRLDDRARQAARRPWREPDWDARADASHFRAAPGGPRAFSPAPGRRVPLSDYRR